MKDRIIKIMNAERLSSSRFAEEIGIQRAAMSHITSGRNNPSLDVVTKILERFPSINPNWLLFGNGEMKQNDTQVNANRFSTNAANSQDLFSNPSGINPQPEKKSEYRTDEENKKTYVSPKLNKKESAVYNEASVKKIEKIMIFYTDNTYELFNPESKK